MFKSITLAALVLGAATPLSASYPDNYDWRRADQNYQQLLRGTRQFAELTPLEREELVEYRKWLDPKSRDYRSRHQKCMDDEIDGLRHEPTYLDMRVIRMKCRGEEGS